MPTGLQGYQANVLAPVQVPPKWVVISDLRVCHALLEDRLWWLADLEHWMAKLGRPGAFRPPATGSRARRRLLRQ